MIKKSTITLTLEPDAADLLERATGGRRVAGAYLSRLLRERWQEWTAALDDLRRAGWQSTEVLAACDALNGYWDIGLLPRSGSAVALELSDAQELNGLCEKWEVDPEIWRERVVALSRDTALAASLLAVVREFWADSSAAETAVRGLKSGASPFETPILRRGRPAKAEPKDE